MSKFQVVSEFKPEGDQPKAIEKLKKEYAKVMISKL